MQGTLFGEQAAPEGPTAIRIGGKAFQLERYAPNAWRTAEPRGIYVRKESRVRWVIAVLVEAPKGAKLSGGVEGTSFEHAEQLLDEQLEPVRHLVGAPEVRR